MSDVRLLKGLVLSGGASYGSFQAGALKWLIENGHTYDCISGTSIGSVNAGVLGQFSPAKTGKYAWANAGKAVEDLWLSVDSPQKIYQPKLIKPSFSNPLDLFRTIRYGVTDGPKLLRRLIIAFLMEGRGLLDVRPGERFFGSMIDAVELEKVLQEPEYTELFLNAVSLKTGKNKVFTRKEITQDPTSAIMASSAIPFVFPTRKIDGVEYVDGGIRSNALVTETLSYLTDRQRADGELARTGKTLARLGDNLTIDVVLCFSQNPLEGFWRNVQTPPGLYTILQSAYCLYEELISGSLDEARAAFPNATINVIQPDREKGDPIAFTEAEIRDNLHHGYDVARRVMLGDQPLYQNLLYRLQKLLPDQLDELFK